MRGNRTRNAGKIIVKPLSIPTLTMTKTAMLTTQMSQIINGLLRDVGKAEGVIKFKFEFGRATKFEVMVRDLTHDE